MADAAVKESSQDSTQDKEKSSGEEDVCAVTSTSDINGQKEAPGNQASKGEDSGNQDSKGTDPGNQDSKGTDPDDQDSKGADPGNQDDGPSALEEKIIRQIEVIVH